MTKARKAAIAPFLRRRTWWARIPRLGATSVQRSLGVVGRENLETARAVCAFLWTLKGRRESWLLDELAAGRITAGEAFDAYQNRRLDAYIEERRAGKNDPDLEPMVALFEQSMRARKRPNAETAAKYAQQVRRLIPAGTPFPKSQLTRKRIAEHLDTLGLGQPNRHRAALSRFCRFLIERDVLDVNPVRSVQAASERPPRCRHLSDAEAVALLGALEEPFRTLHALLLGTGMEVSAALRLRRDDIDFPEQTVRAKGTKRQARDRTVRITEPWALAALDRHCRGLLTMAPVFPGLTRFRALAALQEASAAVQITDYRTHDHRHTYAVRELRKGQPLSVIAHQLGHANTVMVQKVYGRFIPNETDYVAPRLLRQSATSKA